MVILKMKVILKNVTEDKTVDEELLTITDGLLLVTSNVKNIVSEDDIGDVELRDRQTVFFKSRNDTLAERLGK